MEGIHGVDVSWLHHSNKAHHYRPHAPASAGLSRDAPPPNASQNEPPVKQDGTPAPQQNHVSVATDTKPQPSPIPAAPPATRSTPKRPSLLSRVSSEKVVSQSQQSPTTPKTTSRRNSWISNISSKFSSQSAQAPAAATSAQAAKPQTDGFQVPAQSTATPAKDAQSPTSPVDSRKEQAEEVKPYVPQQPKNSSFLSSALRRLSSGSGLSAPGKAVPGGGVCPRKVMNIDPYRQRCLIPELNQSKLRRVAFCVDVEIAAGPRYKEDADPGEKKKKNKDKKMKERGEGEALKHPQAMAEQKDRAGVLQATGEMVGDENPPDPEDTVVSEEHEPSRKKEKKKRSEAERKERKEKKRKKAEDNGQVPREMTQDSDESSSPTPPEISIPVRPQDRPTTDPLRIYRRCCQLRETPVLKRISDQLAAPSNSAAPGVLASLDLTGSRLTLADVETLSDWLAVVPVKRLLLEDADLTDEGVRVILAGLLAAKAQDYSKRRKRDSPNEERSGVVEKLTLKNNPKITREGWRHISLFINMCKSLKAIDVSMVTFPQSATAPQNGSTQNKPDPIDMAELLSKAFAERSGGSTLEELMMAECNLTAPQLRKIIDGITISGVRRLGLAGNRIDEEGLEHVIRYIRSNRCDGLDLGGNDMRGHLARIGEALHEECPLWALCLANCNLTPESINPLFPALLRLPDFRFLDLSHNRNLFSTQPSALATLRKYIPQLPLLKRLHLMDVSMSPAQAIGLAEVLPESRHLAHLNIMQNPQLTALASARDEASQEEACALYASLMAAVRVSNSIICIDVDVPSQDSSEVVKALAKQVVGYCLRNMQRFAALEAPQAVEAVAAAMESGAKPNGTDVPEVLLHLVGHMDGSQQNHDQDEPAPDDDYIVGGTGVVKALSYCLSEKASDLRRSSMIRSGTSSPKPHQADHDKGTARAKEMSKNLLESARKIRTRLQPALLKEARAGEYMSYRRLLFLDTTLAGMIQRFEDEYPECRPAAPHPSTFPPTSDAGSRSSSPGAPSVQSSASLPPSDGLASSVGARDDSDEERPVLRSRHNSDVSVASRALALEEGRIHRIGQKVRRDILRPQQGQAQTLEGGEVQGGVAQREEEQGHLVGLRARLEGLSGEEMRRSLDRGGWEETLSKVGANAEDLKRLQMENPEEWRAFREAQEAAQMNAGMRV